MIRPALKNFIQNYIVFFTRELPELEEEFKGHYSIITSEWLAIRKDIKSFDLQTSQSLYQQLDDLFEKAEVLYYRIIGADSYSSSTCSKDIQSRWTEIQRVGKDVLNKL